MANEQQSVAKFQFFLNRQGPKGNQGPKGDTGFSPSIEVDTNTAAEYRLKIINEDNEIITDNLRGSAVDDMGGTYMRYDPETQKMFAGTADPASDISYGVVRIAGEADIENMDSVGVVSAGQVADALHVYLKSADGSVTITQDEEDFKTDLSVDFSGVEGDISGLESRVTGCESGISNLEQADITITNNVTNLQGRMTTAENTLQNHGTAISGLDDRLDTVEHNLSVDEQAITNNTTAITSLQSGKVDKVAGKGLSTNDFTNEDNTKLMHAVVDTDLANVAFTGDYTDLINKPSIPTVDNMMTVDTAQSVTGAKKFTGNTLNVGDLQNNIGSVAHYDSTLYPTTETNVSRVGGVVLGNVGVSDINTLASQWMFEYDDSIQGYRLAQIFNDFNLVGGTNASVVKNSQTGKYEIVAMDTTYNEGDGIDISASNAISVKVDGTTVDFNSSGELTVIGGGGGSVIDDTQASLTTTYSSTKIGNTYLPLAGGSITGQLSVSGNISSITGNISTIGGYVGGGYIRVNKNPSATTGTGTVITLGDSSTDILLNAFNNNITFGMSAYNLRLVGAETRPKYNNNDIALYSDITAAIGNINSVLDAINGEVI